jgi:hypothetical protein
VVNLHLRFDEGRVGRATLCRLLSYSTEQPSALMEGLKAKNKTFLRRQNQDHVGGSARLPLVGYARISLVDLVN